MLAWIARGLSRGAATTRYPRRPEPAPAGYRGRVEVLHEREGGGEALLAALCPTGAITVSADGRLQLDRARCILCGDCVRAAPERFAMRAQYETASRVRPPLPLRRSIHVRHIDCGSDGSEEWEIQALWNPYYDIQRLGFFLTNAPRHADVLLVTGPVTAPMAGPLLRTWEVMPAPKVLVAVGSDACSGGLRAGDREPLAREARTPGGLGEPADEPAAGGGEFGACGPPTAGGVDAVLPVDVYVPGSPPAPIAIMHGLLLATGLLEQAA